MKNLLLVIILSGVVYSANIWGISVYILDEAKNAGCAMEMYQRGDWVVPTFNGTLRTDKPPLHYYFMKVAYGTFGINPFSARVFSSIMGMFTVLAVYFFSRKIWNERTALYAALILISSLQLAIQFHLAVPDPYFIFFLTMGWLSFAYAFIEGKTGYYYLFYVSVGLATLAKGPAAVIFSGLLVLAFLIAQRRFSWRSLRQIKILQGSLLFLVIVLPWYVAVGIQTEGAWLEQFFFKHNVRRFTASMEGHGGFPLASVVIVILALIPFSFFFPQAIKMVWRERKQNPALQFCFVAMTVVVVFFLFSRTILPSYPEPALPFFAILLGYCFNKWHGQPEHKDLRLSINAVMYFTVAFSLPWIVWFGLRAEKDLHDLANLSIYFSILSIGAGVALIYVLKKKLNEALYTYSFTSIAFLITFFYIIFPAVNKRNPVEASFSILRGTEIPVVAYKDFNPAYVFMLQRPIKRFDSETELENYSQHTEHFYLISQKKHLREISKIDMDMLFERRDLFEKPVTVVLKK